MDNLDTSYTFVTGLRKITNACSYRVARYEDGSGFLMLFGRGADGKMEAQATAHTSYLPMFKRDGMRAHAEGVRPL